jgi:hypothetical protein
MPLERRLGERIHTKDERGAACGRIDDSVVEHPANGSATVATGGVERHQRALEVWQHLEDAIHGVLCSSGRIHATPQALNHLLSHSRVADIHYAELHSRRAAPVAPPARTMHAAHVCRRTW